MKTRIIKTSYWQDTKIHSLSKDARLLFIYLLTCPHINLCGIFELPDIYIKTETGLTNKKLEGAKKELEKANRVKFYEGYISIVNAERHNHFQRSPKTKKAYDREISHVPQNVLEVLKYYDTTIDSTINSSSDSLNNQKPEYSNQKLETRIQKEGEREGEEEPEPEGEVLNPEEQEAIWFLQVWNFVFGTKFKSTVAIKDNLAFWRQHYEREDIKAAVAKARSDPYWKNIIDPETFLRQKNTRHERVDRIASFLNRETAVSGANVNIT